MAKISMMDDTARNALVLIREAADYLANLEGQDHILIIEMTISMIDKLLAAEGLERVPDVAAYVRRYCNVIDGPADADPITAAILNHAAALIDDETGE